MQNTAPVIEDGRVLVSAIKDGYNAYLTYTEQLLKLHNENMARLLSDAVAINPWWSPKANETIGEWADLYVSSVESTIEWVRRIQQSPPTASLALNAAYAVQGNGGEMQSAVDEIDATAEDRRDARFAPRTTDVHDEPANDDRPMHGTQNSEARAEESRNEPPAADAERRDAEAPAGGRRGQRTAGERRR